MRRSSRATGAWPHLLALTVLALGIAFRLGYLPFNIGSPDEDTYVGFYGGPLKQHGLSALPALLADYNSRPPMQQFPPPTRIGYILPVVGAMKLGHDSDLASAATLSTWFSIALLLVIYALAWALDSWAVAIALLLAAFSPLDLAMARRAWPDELLSLVSALMALLLVRAVSRPGGAWAAVAALALGAYATLVKETGALLLAFATLLLAFHSWRARGVASSARWLLGGLAAFAAAVGLTALAFRGLAPVWGALTAMQRAATHNPYVLHYQTGDARYYVRGLALLQPLPMVLGFAGAALALRPSAFLASRLRGSAAHIALITLGWMTLALAAAMTALPQKNLRFLSPIYPLLFLLAGALIVAVWRALATRMARAARAASAIAIAVALIGAAWLDHARFVDYFVARGIADLAVPWFTR